MLLSSDIFNFSILISTYTKSQNCCIPYEIMYSKFDNCIEHPLGILCKCTDYQKIVNEFKSYNIGTEHYLLPKMNTEPIASAKVLWIKNHLKLGQDISKPILLYSEEQPNINTCNIDKMWVPIIPDLIPLKFILKL